MKKLGIIIVLLSMVIIVNAQNDTTFYYKDNKIYLQDSDGELKVRVANKNSDSAENLLFEGTYGEDYSSEININYTFSKLTKSNENKSNKLQTHGMGYGFGDVFLSSRNFNEINYKENAVIKLGLEFDWNFYAINFRLSPKYRWSFFTGFGLKWNLFYSDENTSFNVVDGKTVQVQAPEDIYYSRSSLYATYFKIPAMIEWQTPFLVESNMDFFVQAGFEFGVKLYSGSSVEYRENRKRITEKIGKGMNMNPVCLDLKAGFGLGDFYIYGKYGLISLFKNGKGPDVIPISLGIVFNVI